MEDRQDCAIADRVEELVRVPARSPSGTAMARTGDEDGAQSTFPDRPIHVGVDEVQTGSRAPVAEQSWLDVLRTKWLTEQRVVEQVDLTYRQVVRRAPPTVQPR